MTAIRDPKIRYLLIFMKMEEKVEAIEETSQPSKFSMKNPERNLLSPPKSMRPDQ